MPVLFQKHIVREDLRRNQRALYVFGDNVERRGYGGQAREMRQEPNAVGVATKYSPYVHFDNTDIGVDTQNRIIDQDMKPLFEQVKNGGVVIWPSRGIGTGLANLKEKAPDTFDYLMGKLAALLRTADLFDKATPS